MSAKRYKDKARALVITPLGHLILRAVAAGTYQFAPTRGRYGASRRGLKQRNRHAKT